MTGAAVVVVVSSGWVTGGVSSGGSSVADAPTGSAPVAGWVGAETRFEYTVVGDPVNVSVTDLCTHDA